MIDIKIYDLNRMESGEDVLHQIADFVQAMQENGVVGIKVEGLEEIIKQGYQATRQYFDLPQKEKEKRKFSIANGGGYQPFNAENLGGLAAQEEENEFKESFLLFGGNQLATEMAGFDKIEQFATTMNQLANRILHIFQQFFQVDQEERVDFNEESNYATTRLTHYPPMQHAPPKSIWCAAHLDSSPFALLPRATNSGLQLYRISDQTWVDVDVPENMVILNTGRLFEAMTAGLVKPAYHRVFAKGPVEERYSLIYFPCWRPDFVIKAWTSCAKLLGQPDKSLLEGRVDRLFYLLGALGNNFSLTHEQIRELHKEFPHFKQIVIKWPWLTSEKQS